MPDEPAAELVALRNAVAMMTTNVAVLTEATNNLRQTINDLRTSAVPRGEYEQRVGAVEKDVADMQAAHQQRERDDVTFRRNVYLALIVFALGILGSLATLVVTLVAGGGKG